MYHALVGRIARRNFERVNDHDYDAVLDQCVPDVHHRFGGDHALGGERHDTAGLRAWFERLGRVCPTLTLTVTDVWVKGLPSDTVIVMRWTATQQMPDDSPYLNRGVHVIRMRWGKVTDIDANENSQLVADGLAVIAAHGTPEAAAPPILT